MTLAVDAPAPESPDLAAKPDLAALLAENVALRQLNELLTAVVTHSPAVIFVKDTDGRLVLCNRRYETLVDVGPGELLGKSDADIFGAETGEQIRINDLGVCERGVPQEIEELIPQSDGLHTYISLKFPVYDGQGRLRGLAGIATDITERKRQELEKAELQQRIIDVQRDVLRELSTPILPLGGGVIAMPIIGTVDPERARRIMQALLEGIGAHRSHTAIIDITGVRSVDAQVAGALLQAARAARLLGTRVLLTGIRPEVAQALVGMDTDWGGIETLATLQDGVALALRRAAR